MALPTALPTLLTLANASNPHPPSVGDALELMVVGLTVVGTALFLIYLMIVVLRAIEASLEKPAPEAAPATAAAAAAPAPVPVAPEHPGIPPEIVVLLTAAVAATVRSPFRLRRVKLISQDPSPTWAVYGRRSIHTSHRLRKN